MKASLKIGTRVRVAMIGAAALILAIAGSPRIAGAVQSTCNGAFDLQYPFVPDNPPPAGLPSVKNFPQPVPPGNTGDDLATVELTLGAGSIQNGTTLNVSDVRFDLDCDPTQSLGPPCTDAGNIINYTDDTNIRTDCVVGPTNVTWASSVINTNEIKFTPTPALPIPAGTTAFCHLWFVVKVANLPSAPANTSGTTKETAYYGAGTTCNNTLTAAN